MELMKTIETTQYTIKYSIDDDCVILENITVYAEYRGQGYAKQAMTKFLQEVDGRIELAAVPQDDTTDLYRLVEFYEKFGFKIEYDTGTEVLMYRN